MRSYSVLVTIPDVVAHHAQQRVTVTANSWHVAAARGIRLVMGRTGIKGKRHSHIRVDIVAVADREPESQTSKHCDSGHMNDVRFGTGDDE